MYLYLITTIIALPVIINDVQSSDVNYVAASSIYDECNLCMIIVNSFKNDLDGILKAIPVKSEEKLRQYIEKRFTLIQENICEHELLNYEQCHIIAEKSKKIMLNKDWSWNTDDSANLHSYICIEKLEVCCPKLHYGPNCTSCPTNNSNICNGNGKCQGDGTRKGNGACMCNEGYSGQYCENCIERYYLSYKDENEMSCSLCEGNCMDGCRNITIDCSVCSAGFSFDTDKGGCTDINECNDLFLCEEDQYCINTLGSFVCGNCDVSCDGCYDSGPDMCKECANEYVEKGHRCVPDKHFGPNENSDTTNRFLVYLGLLTSTGFLLKYATRLGCVVGLIVIGYILGTEYYLMMQSYQGLANMEGYDYRELYKKMFDSFLLGGVLILLLRFIMEEYNG